MSTTTVAIELLDDRIDVAAVRGGRIHAATRRHVSLPAEGAAWQAALGGASDALRDAVRELGVSGKPAAVLYRSPTQSVGMSSYQLPSREEARDAAIRGCADGLPYPLDAAVAETVAIGRDRTGSVPRTHVVVAADRKDAVDAIVDLVNGVGLELVSATPLDAATLTSLLDRALAHVGPPHGWLHFGERSSFFVLGDHGAVRFQHPIPIGFGTLVRTLTRPMPIAGGDAGDAAGETIELDVAAARTIVLGHGIPDDDEPVHRAPTLTRRDILPAMRPALQRYVIELRQSLRLGVAGGPSRTSIAITLTGPGSRIPGFDALIAAELGLAVEPDGSARGYDHGKPAGEGSELAAALKTGALLRRLNLEPADPAGERDMGGMRRWMWAGGVGALLAVTMCS